MLNVLLHLDLWYLATLLVNLGLGETPLSSFFATALTPSFFSSVRGHSWLGYVRSSLLSYFVRVLLTVFSCVQKPHANRLSFLGSFDRGRVRATSWYRPSHHQPASRIECVSVFILCWALVI